MIKRTKESRKWDNGGSKKDVVDLDHSKPAAVGEEGIPREEEEHILPDVRDECFCAYLEFTVMIVNSENGLMIGRVSWCCVSSCCMWSPTTHNVV